MFELNFISEPGMQNETSDANWSFLNIKNKLEKNKKSDPIQSKASFNLQNNWINYAMF